MKKFTSLMLAVSAFALSNLQASTTKVVYDFSSASSFTNDYYTNYTGAPVSWTSTGGLNNGGALDLKTGDGNQAWFSKSTYEPLTIGQALQISVYFKYNSAGSGPNSIKLGLTNNSNSLADFVAMPTNGNWIYFGNWSYGGGDVGSEIYSDKGPAGNVTDNGNVGFQNGQWYQTAVTFTKVAVGTFNVSCALNTSDSQGNLTSTMLFGSTPNIYMPELDTNLYAYIGFENPDPSTTMPLVSNIEMKSDGTISGATPEVQNSDPIVEQVPEPSTAALLLGVGGLLGLRRFLRW